MFGTQRKDSIRGSLLKNTAKHTANSKQRVESTGMGLSLRFREPRQIEEEVQEFTADLPPSKSFPILPQQYLRSDLLKDVNYLNGIYNHILVMISSHLNTPNDSKNYQLTKMSKQIQRIIMENVQLKGKIDAKYRSMMDLHQLAAYLKTTPMDLKKNQLQGFLEDFDEKQKEAERLSKHLQQLQSTQKSKKLTINNAKIHQKQQKCKTLRKAIDKQSLKISKMQSQQKSLLRKLYDTQKQIVKNQHSSSAIKLKLKQAEGDEKIRSKTRQSKIKQQNKENKPPNKDKSQKCIKVDRLQGPKLFRHRNI